jgi:hypothetical protein
MDARLRPCTTDVAHPPPDFHAALDWQRLQMRCPDQELTNGSWHFKQARDCGRSIGITTEAARTASKRACDVCPDSDCPEPGARWALSRRIPPPWLNARHSDRTAVSGGCAAIRVVSSIRRRFREQRALCATYSLVPRQFGLRWQPDFLESRTQRLGISRALRPPRRSFANCVALSLR